MRIKIIGSGTSGLAAGITQLKKGNQVEIFEARSEKTDDKACGGICPKKTVDLLKQLVPDIEVTVPWCIYKNATVYDRVKGEVVEVDKVFFDGQILRVDKHLLLDRLRKEFVKLGGVIHYNSPQKIEKDPNFDLTINASGAPVERTDNGRSFAIETYEFDCDKFKNFSDANVLYDKRIDGYFWIMRCESKKYVIGAIGEKDYKNVLNYVKDFVKEMSGLDPETLKYHGAYSTHKFYQEYTNNVLNIGDAAGLCRPISYEGLYHSLLSGIQLENYDFEASKKDIKKGNFISKFLYKCVGKVKFCMGMVNKDIFKRLLDDNLCNEPYTFLDFKKFATPKSEIKNL